MDFIHPRWCEISSINSIANWSSLLMKAILSCSHEIYKYRNYVSIVNSLTCYIVRPQQPNTRLRKPSAISLLKTQILSPFCTITTFQHTVDGRIPAPPGMYYKTLRVNNGINYQPQLVSRISEPSTVPFHRKFVCQMFWFHHDTMTSFTASLASFMDCGINTPLPAARPLAFTTNSRPAAYSSCAAIWVNQSWVRLVNLQEASEIGFLHSESKLVDLQNFIQFYNLYLTTVAQTLQIFQCFSLRLMTFSLQNASKPTSSIVIFSWPRHISKPPRARLSWKSSERTHDIKTNNNCWQNKNQTWTWCGLSTRIFPPVCPLT